MSMLDDAVQAIRLGNREEGRRLLEEMLEVDDNNEQVWLWLTSVVETDEDRAVCLENVLALNPHNVIAQRGLDALQQGTFNVSDIMSQALEEHREEELPPGRTFLDEFELGASDDLVMPSTMGGSDAQAKPKAVPAKGRAALNPRRILLLAFVLLVLCGLGAALAFNFVLGGGDETEVIVPPPPGEPGQAGPVGGEEPAAPVTTDTPTPTVTPTLTNTPDLSLPTPRPTQPPTPTSTPVVPPTPG